jgi:putative tryptophan/tyrosine transport system substrate-binding protein
MIPIVMFSAADPVAREDIASLARPGGNITGINTRSQELSGKLLELLHEAIPQMTSVAVLTDPKQPDINELLSEMKDAAQALGVQPRVLEVRDPDEFERAFDAATIEGAGALLILPGLLFSSHLRQLATLAVKKRLPAIYGNRFFAELGGLMTYEPSTAELWRRAAALVDRILKGVKPADLPVEQPMHFEFVINLKTAQALGLTIPPTLLLQATEVLR